MSKINRFKNALFLSCVTVFFLMVEGCGKPQEIGFDVSPAVPASFQAVSEAFEKRIEKVADGVYVAIGYGLANSILIEGEDSIIIIDCLESMEAGAEVREAFRKITSKPLKAIIYTHHHADHTFGAAAMAANERPDIYAHELWPHLLDQTVSMVRPVLEKRAQRMFGLALSDEVLVHCGIGKKLKWDQSLHAGIIRPNVTFGDSLITTIAGIQFHFYHAPGETPDHLMIWLPDRRILFCGDNVYKAFPNLYSIRGTPHRDVIQWMRSVDRMRYLGPELLVPSHTGPVTGKDKVYQILTDYRDAIQFVHDQTVQGMNAGLTADELADRIRLPEHLRHSPYLQEIYGKVEWSVRSIFTGYLGYFDGNPVRLHPLGAKDRAVRVEKLVGGEEAFLHHINRAYVEGDYQWALELCELFLQLHDGHPQATKVYAQALIRLGERQVNPNARHYYLTCALECNGLELKEKIKPSVEMVHQVPLAAIFQGMAVRLNSARSERISKKVEFHFEDTGEKWSVQIRNGVAEVQPFSISDPDITIKISSDTWRELAAGMQKPMAAFLSGKITIRGSIYDFLTFLRLFDFNTE